MSAHRAVLLALLVVGGSLAVAAPTSATVDSADQRVDPGDQRDAADERRDAGENDAASSSDAGATGPDADGVDDRSAAVLTGDAMVQNESENENENSSLGADISSFMQSSAAEIDGAVETGMWSAAFNGTNDRSQQQRLVERRTDDLRAELTDLQERREELVAERDDGNVSDAAYKARIGQLLGRIDALQSAINATEPRARQSGANVDDLEALESDARNLAGPEIAAIARNTSGVGNGSGPPGDVGNGPPEGAGNGSNGVGNGNGSDVAGPPGDVGNSSNGPPADVGNGPLEDASNRSETGVAGPPEDVPANGTGLGNAGERGPPGDAPNRTDPANRSGESGPATNVTVPGSANESDDSDGPGVGVNLTADSVALGPVANAAGAQAAAALRALALS